MSDNNKDDEILKIRDLINKKYSHYKKKEDNQINQTAKNFIDIKRSADQLNNNIKQQTLEIKNSIETQENELKKLQNDEIVFNQNILQVNIIDNQKKLIDEYRENNEQLKLNLINLEKKLLEKDRFFKINNDELKNTLSRYIANYKKIEEELNSVKEIKKDLNEVSLDKSKLEEMNSKIKFYQDENTRLSSEIFKIKKNYETIKNNFTNVETQKNDIFKKIKELNNSLTKNNIVGTPFINEPVEEDSINSEILNDIIDTNLNEEKKNSDENNNLDEVIGNIFK